MDDKELRAFMARNKITSQDLADRLNLSKSYIDKMRTGNKPVSKKVIEFINTYKGEDNE